MKGYFYPFWRRVSSLSSSFLLPCLLISISFFSFLPSVEAKTVVIGTGSGSITQTSMGTLNPGDTLAINPGSYGWTQLGNLNNITIINNGGLVTFTDVITLTSNTNVNFTGTGAPGITYGFYVGPHSGDAMVTYGSFTGCTWSNIEFVGCNGGNGAINPQNNMIKYDGVNNNTKEFYLCKFTNIHLSGSGSLMDNYQGPFYNVQDSCEYSYIIVDNAGGPTQINATSFYRANIHHWSLNGITSWPQQDVGAFVINGSVRLHHNTRSGTQWGWFIRLIHQALMGTGDSYIYNNIDVGSIGYGFVDYRLSPLTSGMPFTAGGNVYCENNTVGNYQNQNGYATCVLLDYGHAGFIADVRNNIRFNSTNYTGYPDSLNTINFGPPGNVLYTSNNMYFANPVASGALAETVTCFEKPGSPTIDAGTTIPWITDDISGITRPQGAAYDIGAREYNQNTPPPANKAPVAIVGAKQTITLPTNIATLDGSKSMDSDGYIASYAWTQVSGPSSTISNPAIAKTSATGLTQGTYIFQLTVTDNQGATGKAYDTIVVNPAVNQPPVAIAGAKQTLILPTNTASLDGSKSYDPDGTIAAFAWSQVSGPATTVANATAAIASVSGLAQGTYIFQLTVTDNSGAIGSAFDTVIVIPAPNQPPVAIAGAKQTITLPTNSASLDGSKSYDPDGTIVSYAWSEISGPATSIASATASVASVSSLTQGTYIFQLVVTDNGGAVGSAFDTVVVNPVPNQPPVAIAGAKQTITLPNNTASLDGSQSYDPDGTIAAYAWSQIAGTTTSIGNASGSIATLSGLAQGNYIFKLTVTDNLGATGTAYDTVVVRPAVTNTPVADAGFDQSITLPTNSVTLNGSGSYDSAGTITTYSWTQVSGPSTAGISAAGSVSTAVTGLQQGVYVFQLQVTDNSGFSATDQVAIRVNPAPNQPPVANAGSNQNVTLPISVSLNGTKSYDPDGTIASYSWTETSGPVTATITNGNTATPTISGLQAGVYVFQLTVTDNQGATSTAQVTITVNAAPNQPPVANAGANQTITLPATASLDGTKSTDPDGSIASYSWTEISGPGVAVITNGNTATPTISGLQAGVYVFQLKVTDNQGATSTAQVTITVDAANQPPIANAGNDQSITLPINTVTLDGSKSYDPDGTIAAYSWVKISGPGAVTITNSNTAKPSVLGLLAGTYVFQLTVTDNKGATGSDQVTITVNAAANQPPVANAGANLTITLPTNTVNLDGTKSSDPDGSIVAYTWSQNSGPSTATVTNPNTATPTVSNLLAGVYVFKLTVTDNQGASGTATVTVTVIDPAVVVQAPVANAGQDTTIALPANSAVLDGSGSSDQGGSITNYQWTEMSGPNSALFNSNNTVVSSVSSLIVGDYVFQLTVTNAQGMSSTATVNVTVVDNLKSSESLLLYPNPASSVVNLQLISDTTGTVKVNIFDMGGKLVRMLQMDKEQSYMNNPINIASLASGMYVVQVVIGNNKKMVAKLLKQ